MGRLPGLGETSYVPETLPASLKRIGLRNSRGDAEDKVGGKGMELLCPPWAPWSPSPHMRTDLHALQGWPSWVLQLLATWA